MTTFFFFGNYTRDAVDGIDASRTERAERIIQGYGGKLRSVYALLGVHDLVMIADLPGIPEAVKVSVEIMRDTGVQFATAPALPVAEFDRFFSA